MTPSFAHLADDRDGQSRAAHEAFCECLQALGPGAPATPPGHARPIYRNFFPPQTRWQFSGLRLARDLPSSQGKT